MRFLFVGLWLTLPPPGPRVGQRRLLQQTSNRWVLEALQGEGLPALRGDDRKRPALWLFSQIFPALVFVQDWLGPRWIIRVEWRLLYLWRPMVPQLACATSIQTKGTISKTIGEAPCGIPAFSAENHLHLTLVSCGCATRDQICVVPRPGWFGWNMLKPDSAGWRYPVDTMFIQWCSFFENFPWPPFQTRSRVWDRLRSLNRCHIFGWIHRDTCQIHSNPCLVSPSTCAISTWRCISVSRSPITNILLGYISV